MASDPPSPPVCLRLFLYPGVGNSYAVQLDLLIPANEALRLTATDVNESATDEPATDEPAAEFAVQFPAEALRAAHADPAAYGTMLAQAVFAPEVLREGLQQAQQIATRMGRALQLEIALERSVAELYEISWTWLRDPQHDTVLSVQVREDAPTYLRHTPHPPSPPPMPLALPHPEPEPLAPTDDADPGALPNPRLTGVMIGCGFFAFFGSCCPFGLGMILRFGFVDDAIPVTRLTGTIYLAVAVALFLVGMWLLYFGFRRDNVYRRVMGHDDAHYRSDWGS